MKMKLLFHRFLELKAARTGIVASLYKNIGMYRNSRASLYRIPHDYIGYIQDIDSG
jgi:hypothetical protein